MHVTIPEALTRAGGAGSTAAGAAWVATVPALVRRAVERWNLSLGEPFGVGTASWTAPGTLPDGTPIVLKISFPHDEARYEAIALATWRGSAAVELLDHDAEDWALLLRRAHPGTPMLTSTAPPDERIDAAVGVLANLHRADVTDPSIPSLHDACLRWAAVSAERASRWSTILTEHHDLVARGVALWSDLAASFPLRPVLLHGDLNPGNLILDSPSQPHWLAIDPKPMLGDPAYELWPVLSQIDDPFAYPDPLAVAAPRLQRACATLGVQPGHAARWAFARTVEAVLWKLDTWPTPEHQADALAWLHEARCWAALADTLG